MIDYSKFVENSRKWLKEYIQNNHLQIIVVGISGGLDSCISACLASPVCEELNIPLIGRSLPTKTNKSRETDVANLVGKAFCTDYKEVQINCEDIIHELELCEGKMTALQKGNVKARYRMIYLYNLASIHKGVVLDNDNFTEYNVGFFTFHGDQGDLNLGLHYLWKTEIYELADFLADGYVSRAEMLEMKNIKKEEAIKCRKQYNTITESIQLIPTDGNGVSNSDCEQFGLDNYGQVDDVLQTMYYRDSLEKVFSSHEDQYIRLIDSYNEQGVDKVMMLHQNTAYKRKPSPIMPTRK